MKFDFNGWLAQIIAIEQVLDKVGLIFPKAVAALKKLFERDGLEFTPEQEAQLDANYAALQKSIVDADKLKETGRV